MRIKHYYCLKNKFGLLRCNDIDWDDDFDDLIFDLEIKKVPYED